MIPQPPKFKQPKEIVRSNLHAQLSYFAISWREGHLQARKDFLVRWRDCGRWLLVTIWLVTLIFSLIILILIDTGLRSDIRGDLGACLPDGSFSVEPDTYRYFSGSGFFEITLAFGSMSFTQVKVLDVAWDIVVGRGGQSLLAYISWRVFANYVTTSMEVMPVTFRTYRTIFLQKGPLLVEIPRLIRDFCYRHALHSKLAMIFMVFTMALSLAFPTLAGSLTGYKGKVEAFVQTTQGNYIPFHSFDYVGFIVHDGGRINLTDNYYVGAGGLEPGSTSSEPIIQNGAMNRICFRTSFYYSDDCVFFDTLDNYTKDYGLDGNNNVPSIFNGTQLPPPVLNISAFNDTVGPSSRWLYENTTYTMLDLLENGKCQPNLDYQWGFSFIQSFITVILLFIWSIGTYIMWLRSHSIMKRRGRNDVAGEHKAVLELAQAMQQQHAGLASPHVKERKQQGKQEEEEDEEKGYSVSATTTTTTTTTDIAVPITEAALRHRVSKELRGGSITYTAPLLANGEIADEWTLWTWVQTHKWSLAGMLPSCLLSLLSGIFLERNVCIFLPLPFELGAALYMGSTRASRAVMFFWGFALCSLVPQIVLSAMYTMLY